MLLGLGVAVMKERSGRTGLCRPLALLLVEQALNSQMELVPTGSAFPPASHTDRI